MKAKDAARVARLVECLEELPKVRKRLRAKPTKFFDAFALELSAAEMSDGEGQGSEAYLYLPADLAPRILDAADRVIRDELKRLGVEVKGKA